MRQKKVQQTKHLFLVLISSSFTTIIMDGVDVISQKTAAYRIYGKSKDQFYLRMFFDLIDVALVKSHIVYTELGNDISLLNFKIVVTKALIDKYSHCNRFPPVGQGCKNFMNHPCPESSQPTHSSYRTSKWDTVIAKIKAKTFVSCQTRGLSLWLSKERNQFLKRHLYFYFDYIAYYIAFWK